MLPKLNFSKSKRLAALPLAEIPTLAAELVRLNSPSSKMLLFAQLCANCSGGIYNAKWTEVDLDRGAWTIPKNRTKTKHDDFRIPLSGTAVSLLKSMLPPNGEHVFAHKTGKPFSDAAMLMCIKGIYLEVTVHGTVRQGFKNWAAENGYREDLSGGVRTSELLQNAASGGVRERSERSIEVICHILNHTVQYMTRGLASCNGVELSRQVIGNKRTFRTPKVGRDLPNAPTGLMTAVRRTRK